MAAEPDDDQPSWLHLLEVARPDYLSVARDAARRLLRERDAITIDDVRDVCPPPPDIDPRVMGAVLRCSDFAATGEYVLSKRATCHRRPIQRFRLA